MQISELSAFGFSKRLITTWQAEGIDRLLPIQEQAIRRHKLFDGASLIVSAPTSSGKTFVGELAAVNQGRQRKKTAYLVPLKALAEEKYEHFKRLYEPEGIRIVISTRDRKEFDEDLTHGHFEIAIIVYEKFLQLLNASRDFLGQVGLVVVDELQLLSDPSRGATVELILTRLRMLKGGFQLIGLTAVLGNDRKVNEWLGVELLQYQRRPVELRIGYLWKGMFHYRAYNSQETGEERLLDKPPVQGDDIITALVSKLADKGEQSLVFVKDKPTAHSLAEKMVGELSQPQADEAIIDLDELEPTTSTDELRELLSKGLAIHHADLTPEERSLVEYHFRKGGIRVLVSTTTLAMGVNLPTRNVIIELEKWNSTPGDARPHLIPLPKSEFENMGGRAGRYQLEDEYGRAIAVLTRHIECDQFKNIYLDGNLEDVKPNLWRDSMATTVLGIVALGGCKTLKEVGSFLRNTLTWHLYSEAESKAELEEQLQEGIATCLQVGVLRKAGQSLLEVTDLGTAISTNGIRVETGGMIKEWLEGRGDTPISATEAFLLAIQSPDGQEGYINMTTADFRRNGGRYAQLTREMIGEGLFVLLRKLRTGRLDEYQSIKAYKVALLLTDYAGTMSTHDLEEQYQTYFGAVKRVAEHISWILNSASAISKALQYPQVSELSLTSLASQVQYGLPPDGLKLAELRVPRLGRERIRSLVKEGVTTADHVLEAGEAFIGKVTTKPVAKALFKRIHEYKTPKTPRPEDGKKVRQSKDTRVTQRENHGAVVVGVNHGTIIVNAHTEDANVSKDPAPAVLEDLSRLRPTEWKRQVAQHIDELVPIDIQDLHEQTRRYHHNRLRPLLRDASRSSTLAEIKLLISEFQTVYLELNDLLTAKLNARVLPDYTDDFKQFATSAVSVEDVKPKFDEFGSAVLKQAARLVNLLEEYRTTPEAMLTEVIESFERKSEGVIFDSTGLQPESERQEGFYRRSEIIEAFQNLVGNAMESLEDAKIPAVTFSSSIVGGNCAVRISDNGRGIGEADFARIFDDGYSTKGSNGYGLAHARRVFEQHGGGVRLLKAELGKGATFEVLL